MSSVDCSPFNLNHAAEFICFLNADLTVRDKANKSSRARKEPYLPPRTSVLVRKRLLGLEPLAITCVPRALPLICWVLSPTVCLFSLSQWYWRNVFVQSLSHNSPVVQWFRTEMPLSESYFIWKSWVAIASVLCPLTSNTYFQFEYLGSIGPVFQFICCLNFLQANPRQGKSLNSKCLRLCCFPSLAIFLNQQCVSL